MIYTAYYNDISIEMRQFQYSLKTGNKKSIIDVVKEVFLRKYPNAIILMTRLEFISDVQIINNDGKKLNKVTIEFYNKVVN